MCCVTIGDPSTAEQHHCKFEANEGQQLSPNRPSNRRKSSGPDQLERIGLGRDARSTDVQLKSVVKLPTVFG